MRFNSRALQLGIVFNFIFLSSSFADDKPRGASSTCQNGTLALAASQKGRVPHETDTAIYVVDTNQFYSDPSLLDRWGDKTLVIPRSMIQELDHHKKGFDDRAQTSRTVSARIRRLIEASDSVEGIPLSQGGRLNIAEVSERFRWPGGLDPQKKDDRLIGLALEIQSLNPGRKVVVLSGDNNLAILAKSVGLHIDELKTSVDRRTVKEITEAPLTIHLSQEALQTVLFKETTSIPLAQAREFGLPAEADLHENQYVVFEPTADGAKGRSFDLNDAVMLVWRYSKTREAFYPVSRRAITNLVIQPRNFEQVMAADLLLQRDISLVTLAGRAGTGKTLITLAAGMAQSGLFSDKPQFERIILTRPNAVTGAEMGFLPGSLREKMDPFIGPFKDNLAVFLEVLRTRQDLFIKKAEAHRDRQLAKGISLADILGEKYSVKEWVEKIMNSDFFSVESITYSRGRSWPNTLLIIDEAQNLTPHEVQTILTRAGEGTKVVLLGDLDQIDNRTLNHTNNGLIIAASRFRADNFAGHGHVTLMQGERSVLATKAAELLRP